MAGLSAGVRARAKAEEQGSLNSMAEKTEARWDWLPGIATTCSILVCYGTLAVLGVLSLMGVGIVLHEGAWAAVISVFAVLAALGIGFSYRRHRSMGPIALATVGALMVLWAMFGSYSRAAEIAGFAALVAATLWDWRAKRRLRSG